MIPNFIQYGLFSLHTLHQINNSDIQRHFKRWYNKAFKHDCGLPPFEDDHVSCTCIHRTSGVARLGTLGNRTIA